MEKKENLLTDFTNSILTGYGQIFFCNNMITGTCLLVATFFFSFYSGFLGLYGGVFATLAAYIFKTDKDIIKSGIFCSNGTLIGLALSSSININLLPLLILLTFSAFFSTLLLRILISVMSSKFNIPALSIPFVIVTWIIILFCRESVLSKTGSFYENPFILPVESFVKYNLPEVISHFFISLGNVMYQKSILFGLICFTGIILNSRISSLLAISGYIIGTSFLYLTGVPFEKIIASDATFNYILISMAIGGIFLVLNEESFLYTIFAVIAGSLLSLSSMEFFTILHLPPLAASFNIVTLFFLSALKISINSCELSLYTIPLYEIGSPEENLKNYKEKHILTRIKKMDFSLPFSGYWYVSQGNNGHVTHKREGHYAWDFIAVDESGSSHKNGGERLEDYYTFGLPVFAPASGIVVKIVQNIPDNKPSEKNKEHRWGNYVIIKHDYDMFSEISHFKCNSIFVTENQSVEKGQLLGYCGNSGYSPEPHIHYQLQNGDFTGSQTLPLEFSSYVIKSNPKEILVERGVPQKGQITGNYNLF